MKLQAGALLLALAAGCAAPPAPAPPSPSSGPPASASSVPSPPPSGPAIGRLKGTGSLDGQKVSLVLDLEPGGAVSWNANGLSLEGRWRGEEDQVLILASGGGRSVNAVLQKGPKGWLLAVYNSAKVPQKEQILLKP